MQWGPNWNSPPGTRTLILMSPARRYWTDKRRNYDLLLRRTKERRLKKKKKTSGKGGNRKEPDTDVEDMLLEQVEMEREDKLCVVCQDKEKCIMILPCRHLCICTDCEGPLQLRNNHCPICRRLVRQTIKAYLWYMYLFKHLL